MVGARWQHRPHCTVRGDRIAAVGDAAHQKGPNPLERRFAAQQHGVLAQRRNLRLQALVQGAHQGGRALEGGAVVRNDAAGDEALGGAIIDRMMREAEHVASAEQFHHLAATVGQQLVEHHDAVEHLEHPLRPVAFQEDQGMRSEAVPFSLGRVFERSCGAGNGGDTDGAAQGVPPARWGLRRTVSSVLCRGDFQAWDGETMTNSLGKFAQKKIPEGSVRGSTHCSPKFRDRATESCPWIRVQAVPGRG